MKSAGYDRFHPEALERQTSLEGAPLASFPRRFAALWIDFMIASIAFVGIMIGTLKAVDHFKLVHLPEHVNVKFGFFDTWYSVAWLVAYFTLAAYWGKGRTPGKRILGIRIVSLVHDHLGFWHSLERALGYGASVLEGGFGFFQYFLRPDRRTVHDRIAETIVVQERLKKPQSLSTTSD